ncbi:AAA family ATPase [Roseateles sp. BYS78W]|uniref:AAA family ATPase n=1 Tax=Pelomonas candidula TaxID=3299025 RepID=A0ABW7HEW6_9BURK
MSRPADTHGDWVLWRPNGYGREPLYVPPALVPHLEAEHQQRESERRATEEAELVEGRRVREEEAATEKARANETAQPKPPTVGAHLAHFFEVERHRVLCDVDRIVERIQKVRDGLYGDKDHTNRELKALTAALERGPERSVVLQPGWQEELDDLAVELPAFRGAVEVVTNALALSAATLSLPAIPPLLLVGLPGVGKSYFCRRLTEVLACGRGWLAFDQPTAGCSLRGTDSHWSTARHGLLFELLALGETANPVVVLDEVDKASRRHGSQDIDMLSQLYSALEPETAQRLTDVSLDIELDASQVVYVGTANGLRTLDAALLSRFEVIPVGLPSPDERRESAMRVVESTMKRLGVRGVVRVSPGVSVLLADYTPRAIRRVVERAVGAVVVAGRERLSVEDIEAALGMTPAQQHARRMH